MYTYCSLSVRGTEPDGSCVSLWRKLTVVSEGFRRWLSWSFGGRYSRHFGLGVSAYGRWVWGRRRHCVSRSYVFELGRLFESRYENATAVGLYMCFILLFMCFVRHHTQFNHDVNG